MRINDLNTPGTQTADQTSQTGQTAQARLAGKESAGQKITSDSTVGGADQAEVSHLAQSLAAPGSGRLDHLRLEVQSGKYDVPAQAVAKALIEAHLKE
ncbi:MAG TPA: hypothetical protein VFW44_15125 [Bryobacteraceae bacterium]|nr:hypothetical protein [Bryobacteraceae bacterium]